MLQTNTNNARPCVCGNRLHDEGWTRARPGDRIRRITTIPRRRVLSIYRPAEGVIAEKKYTRSRLLKMPLGGVPVNMYNTCNYLVPFLYGGKKKICAHKHTACVHHNIIYCPHNTIYCTSIRRVRSAASGLVIDDNRCNIGFRPLHPPAYIICTLYLFFSLSFDRFCLSRRLK